MGKERGNEEIVSDLRAVVKAIERFHPKRHRPKVFRDQIEALEVLARTISANSESAYQVYLQQERVPQYILDALNQLPNKYGARDFTENIILGVLEGEDIVQDYEREQLRPFLGRRTARSRGGANQYAEGSDFDLPSSRNSKSGARPVTHVARDFGKYTR